MGLLGDIGDFITGSGQYEDPKAIHPSYGVPMSDVRQAAINQLGNMSAILLAAGQPQVGASRAQILSQLGNAGSGFTTDLYNASQRRLMQANMAEKQAEAADLARIREQQQKDPQGLATSLGVPVDYITRMSPSDLRTVLKQRATEDPQVRLQRGLQIKQLERSVNSPERVEVGGGLYERRGDQWVQVVAPKPTGGLDERSQQLIIAAQRNPAIADTPEYAMAHNQVFGPKMVQAFNPETKQMEYQWVSPPVPPGVIPPRYQTPAGGPAAAAAAAGATAAPAPVTPAGGAPAPVAAPPPGAAAPVISRPPTEEKPLTEDQAKAVGFAARMLVTSKILDPLDGTPASSMGMVETMIGPKIGETASNALRDTDRQLYRQAQENWVRANLRKESGAVIGADEMQKEIDNYFPKPFDAPELIAQKRALRAEAVKAMLVAAGPGAKKAGLEFKPYEPDLKDKIKSMPMADLLQLDVSQLGAPEKAEYLVRLRKLNGGR